MAHNYIKVNTVLTFIGYHLAVAFTIYFGLASESNELTFIGNLLWLVPVNLILASLPNLFIFLFQSFGGIQEGAWKSFLIGELYIVLIQLLMHGLLLVLFIYFPEV